MKTFQLFLNLYSEWVSYVESPEKKEITYDGWYQVHNVFGIEDNSLHFICVPYKFITFFLALYSRYIYLIFFEPKIKQNFKVRTSIQVTPNEAEDFLMVLDGLIAESLSSSTFELGLRYGLQPVTQVVETPSPPSPIQCCVVLWALVFINLVECCERLSSSI